MYKLSERIKQLREERGLSLRELAAICGTSKSSISMYEQGLRRPKYETLEAIADTFNVDMAYLLGKIDVRHAGEQTASVYAVKTENPPVLSEDERKFQELLAEIEKIFRQMSREDQQLYFALLRRGLGK